MMDHCVEFNCSLFSGKSQSITITNENNRLHKDDIARMIREAEEFALDDEQQRNRIEALSNLASSVSKLQKQFLDEEGVRGKLSAEEKKVVSTAIQENSEWIDGNGQTASIEELEEKLSGA